MKRAQTSPSSSFSDIMAFRVVVPTRTDCLHGAGCSPHASYPLIPGRFKDYISHPQGPTAYQSVHTGVTLRDPVKPEDRGADSHA